MIIRPRPRAWELLGIFRLSIVPKILPQILVIAVFSLLIAGLGYRFPALLLKLNVAPFTLLGIALSIFLGFRNNISYDRWWEARRQLGALIGDVRSLARLLMTLPGGDRARRERMVRKVIAYVYALMAHLRSQPIPAQVNFYDPASEQINGASNAPDALLRELSGELTAMLQSAEIGELLFVHLDERLVAMCAIQVACERIKGTPTPFTYTLLLHRTAYAFCFMLPFGLVGTLGFATPIFCAVVAYAFFGLDELASELEEPFGEWVNSLPLSAMARTVEISLLETLGEINLPEPLAPQASVLT
jgi:putative membrane protein